MNRRIAFWLLPISLIPSVGFANDGSARILAHGFWCSRTDVPAYFQEIDFEIKNDVNEFRSYLHARPAEDGVWKLNGNILTLEINQYPESLAYKILRISRNKLVLQRQDENDKTIERYFRTKCDLDDDPFKP